MVPRIYVDTSVIVGCEDSEFSKSSKLLFRAFCDHLFKLVLSETTIQELESAPAVVRSVLHPIPESNIEIVPLSNEIQELADTYVVEGAISNKMYADALHIAYAAVYKVDVLVSWNFKHIVNLRRIHLYNSINLKKGYPMIEIRTPKEIIDND